MESEVWRGIHKYAAEFVHQCPQVHAEGAWRGKAHLEVWAHLQGGCNCGCQTGTQAPRASRGEARGQKAKLRREGCGSTLPAPALSLRHTSDRAEQGALKIRGCWCAHGEPGHWVPGAYVGADYSNGNGSPGLVPGVCPGPLLCVCVCSYIDRLATCDFTWGHKLLTEVPTHHTVPPRGTQRT